MNRKGEKRPLSNFYFDFQAKVNATKASSTGYIVSVMPEFEDLDSTRLVMSNETITLQGR